MENITAEYIASTSYDSFIE